MNERATLGLIDYGGHMNQYSKNYIAQQMLINLSEIVMQQNVDDENRGAGN